MRKIIKFVVIPLIIIILVLGTLLYIKYNTKEVNVVVKSLKGEKISDKIYGYKLNNDLDKNIVFSSPYKDYIYYALTDGNKVYYYRYNIYTLENKQYFGERYIYVEKLEDNMIPLTERTDNTEYYIKKEFKT